MKTKPTHNNKQNITEQKQQKNKSGNKQKANKSPKNETQKHDKTLSWNLSEPSCSLPGGPVGRLLETSHGVPETPLGPHDEIRLRKLTARALWRLAPSWDAPIEFAVAACLHVCYQCSCRRVCLQVHVCRCVCPLVRAVPDWCSWNL